MTNRSAGKEHGTTGGTHGSAEALARIKDLGQPNPRIYWLDFLLSAGLGWIAFGIACIVAPPAAIAAGLAAVLLLYRAHLFIHELSHAARRIKGFQTAWNLLAGFPLSVPSCISVGVHTHHHNWRTYGTKADPEYLPFARSRALIFRFTALLLVFPWLMLLRFVVVGFIALLIPPLQRHLERHSTSMALNSRFERPVDEAEHRRIVRQQIAMTLFWLPILAAFATGWLSWRVAAVWLAVATGISIVNGLRTLGAHLYESTGEMMDRDDQIGDSIDVPGAVWTELWAPVGHRYHALHHLAPALPYHNLPEAYRRLTQDGAAGGPLLVSVRASLMSALSQVWSASQSHSDGTS